MLQKIIKGLKTVLKYAGVVLVIVEIIKPIVEKLELLETTKTK